MADLAIQNKYEVMTMTPNELKEIFDFNQGGEDEINQGDLERIKIPSGGSIFWEMPTLSGPESVKEFEGIIVAWKRSRSYWKDKYLGGGEKPDCRSTDGITGIGNPGGECDRCQLARWQNDEAPDCTDQRILFILKADSILPIVFVLPPTSIPVMRKYMLKLTSRKIPHFAVITQFKLEKMNNPNGQPYARISPLLVRSLDKDEMLTMSNYSFMIKNLVQKTHAEPEDYFIKKEGPVNEEIEITEEDIKAVNELAEKEETLEGIVPDSKPEYDDDYIVMDKFIEISKPDYVYFYTAARLFGFDRKQVHEFFNAKSIKDIPKKQLDDFLIYQYEEKEGKPRY